MGFIGAYFLFIILVCIFYCIVQWRIFVKADKPGWASIVPFYQTIVLLHMVNMSGWNLLLLCIPFVNIVIAIIMMLKLAKVFNKDTGFGVGLILLYPIFSVILAFDSSDYDLTRLG